MARKARVFELPLTPGALSDDTDLAAKLHAIDMDKVRSRGNRWETIKGWTAFNASGMTAGVPRGGHVWARLDGTPLVAAGSESAVNAWVDGSRYDITPYWSDVILTTALSYTTAANPTVTVRWNVYSQATGTSALADHNLSVGDVVTLRGVNIGDGGTLSLNGSFSVLTIPSSTTFTIQGVGTASIQNTFTGQPFAATVAYRSGVVTGTGDTPATRPSIYSMSHFGENLVWVRSEGTPLFMWEPDVDNSEILTNGTFTGNLTGWTAGTNWTSVTNVARHTNTTESNLSQNISASVDAGQIYELTFSITGVTNIGHTLKVLIDSIQIYPTITSLGTFSDIIQTYTVRFVMPPAPTLLIFRARESNTTERLEIDNVSLKKYIKAQPLSEAPQRSYSLFVDDNRICNLLGSIEADGDFNPILLRWCDQENIREWIPATDNVAGEISLGGGSLAMCGADVGNGNLILTNDTAHIAKFTPNGYSVSHIASGCGVVGQRTLVIQNNRAFWPSTTSFYAYDGAQVLPIECPIKDRYVSKLSQYQQNKTFGWLNVEYGEVWFHYPHEDDGFEVSRYVVYNYIEQGNPWSFGTFDRTTMIRSGIYPNPIGLDASGNIWFHEIGTSLSGEFIVAPFIETGYLTSGDGDRWWGCRRYICDVENQTGNIEFTVTGKRAAQGQNNCQSVGPLIMIPGQAKIDFLISARQLKFRWESSASNSAWRLGVVGLEVMSERERK